VFIQVISRGLIYLGVAPTWQQFVVGCMLVVFFILTSLKARLLGSHPGRSGLTRSEDK